MHTFCNKLWSKFRLKTTKIADNIFIVGKVHKEMNPPPYIMYCLRNDDIDESTNHIFYRLMKNGTLFDSTRYKRKRKTKSSVVRYFQEGILHMRYRDFR